jgi:hypothetical protein
MDKTTIAHTDKKIRVARKMMRAGLTADFIKVAKWQSNKVAA